MPEKAQNANELTTVIELTGPTWSSCMLHATLMAVRPHIS